MNDLMIELMCFRHGIGPKQGGLGKAEHFWNVVKLLWGPQNQIKQFVRHPWAERFVSAACAHKFLAVGGCASSSKSDTAAIWSIVNFISAPLQTKVLVTSTSLKESRLRIWGSICDYLRAVPGLPVKIVDSIGLVRLDDGSGENKFSDRCGISLIAGEKKREKEAIGKLIGIKAERLFLIADELSELSEALLEAGLPGGNLFQGNPVFQLIGLSNPCSYFDPFGKLAKPKEGWDSITVEDEEWETNYGWALHFDGLKSPNLLAGKTIYPFLPTQEKIDAALAASGGENSLRGWRMVRGFFPPKGSDDTVYSAADIVKFRADKPAVWGDSPPVRVAALDPAFTNGGDRSMLYFGKVGTTSDGILTLCYDKCEELVEDVTVKSEPRAFQIARQFRDRCIAEGVLPRHAAFDASGAGIPFGDVVAQVWSPEVLRVKFGGAPSELPVSLNDRTPASKVYANRVSEIWFSGKELMQMNQLRGVSESLAVELTSRRYETLKSGECKLKVERKEDLKLRTGRSPDEADAAMLLVVLCRERLGFAAKQGDHEGSVYYSKPLTWKRRFGKLSISSRTNLLAV